jgi:hypothetical protein
LATAGDIATKGEDSAPARLTTPLENILVQLFVNEQLATANADTVEHIENIGEELEEVDGPRELEVAKVARTAVIGLPTAAARLTIIQNTHTRVKEASNARLISIICACIGDLHHGATLNLIWTENPELDTHHGLNIRIWPNKS